MAGTGRGRAPRSPSLPAWAGTLAVLLALTACGGEGVDRPSPTRTDLPSGSVPSVSLTLPTRSQDAETPETPDSSAEPTEEPEEEPTEGPSDVPSVGGSVGPSVAPTPEPTEQPTRSPRPTRSVVITQTVNPTTSVTETATTTQTATPSETETETPSETASVTPSVSASPAAEDADTDEGLPAWLWWVLLVLLAALAAWYLIRSRRRAAWDAEVAQAETEVEWLARELLPQLQQSTTTDALAGGWQVSAARAGAVEDRLTGLEASAPDEPRGTRARTLRDAVRDSRADVEELVDSRDSAAIPVRLAEAVSRLLAALSPPPSHR